MRGARLVRFAGHTVCAANSPAFESEIGNALAAKRPPFAVVWSEQGGKIRVSLRAIGRFDVSKIAEKYGGGGHSNAAGFNLPRDRKLPWT